MKLREMLEQPIVELDTGRVVGFERSCAYKCKNGAVSSSCACIDTFENNIDIFAALMAVFAPGNGSAGQ